VQPYTLSNSDSLLYFEERVCARCERDAAYRNGQGDSCEVLGHILAEGNSSPREWSMGADGPRCSRFTREPLVVMLQRCEQVAKSFSVLGAPELEQDDRPQSELWTSFATLLADPPWLERGAGKSKRGADRHYPLLKTEEIPRVMRASELWRPARNAHLYLWATNNFLPDALYVIAELGFRYVTCITWAKDRYGLGRYYRGQTEHLLFAVRGEYIPTRTNTTSTLLEAPRGRHSAKPTAAYELIEANSPGPRAEFFARGCRPGWASWGNEVVGP
jgi:N6-adenosine-specific RNA methylase IME4